MKGKKYLCDSVTIAASKTLSTDPIKTEGLTQLDIYVWNEGTSNACTITIKGSSTSDAALERTLAVYTFGASQKDGDCVERGYIPRYIWAEIKNNDSVKSAIVTVQLDSQDWN